MALKKSTSQDVKDFAQLMIDDHGAANQKLKQLARQKGLEMSDDASLMAKAKTMILKLREGESFDEAYANNQVQAHEDTIELFRNYAQQGQDQEIKSFAKETLPTLEEHLQKARALVAAHGQKQQRNDEEMNEPQRQSSENKSSGKQKSASGTPQTSS